MAPSPRQTGLGSSARSRGGGLRTDRIRPTDRLQQRGAHPRRGVAGQAVRDDHAVDHVGDDIGRRRARSEPDRNHRAAREPADRPRDSGVTRRRAEGRAPPARPHGPRRRCGGRARRTESEVRPPSAVLNTQGETATGAAAHDREIVRLAVPAFGALAAEPLYVLADTAIVGHLGTRPLAGLGVAGTVLSVGVRRVQLPRLLHDRDGRAPLRRRRPPAGRRARRRRACGSRSASGSSSPSSGWRSPGRSSTSWARRRASRPTRVTYLRISILGAPFVLVALAGTGYLRGPAGHSHDARHRGRRPTRSTSRSSWCSCTGSTSGSRARPGAR